MIRRRVWRRLLAAALGLPALAALATAAWAVWLSRQDFGCFRLGEAVGARALGRLEPVLWVSALCSGTPIARDEYLDGAGHKFAFRLQDPRGEAARFGPLLGPGPKQIAFLRGMFIQIGMANALEPDICRRVHETVPVLPDLERAFGLANGMAWGLAERGRLDAPVGRHLKGQMQRIFFEELGWQRARLAWEGGQRDPTFALLDPLVPDAHRCFSIHGFVRYLEMQEGGESQALSLVKAAPARCRAAAVHGLMRGVDLLSRDQRALPPALRPLRTEVNDQDLSQYDFLP